MQNYHTAAEKAFKWNVSSQHIQYLCRKEKIKGAIKRAGAWFIPDDTPNPIQYTKAGAGDFHFVGTKDKIFNSAVKLFTQKGFHDVSMKDIADCVGIRQSTVYNHFGSKQEILDTIYNFYCHYYFKQRPSLEEMEIVLQNETLPDIFGRIQYDFKEDSLQTMADITKIVFQRIAIDQRAREIGKALIVDEGIKYAEEVFERGIEIGRFDPFDTHVMAIFINSIRTFTLCQWIMEPSPGSIDTQMEDEQALYRYAAKFLTDLHASVKGDSDESPPCDKQRRYRDEMV